MTVVHWERYPHVAALPAACTWLTIQSHLGLAQATIDAYGRALHDYFTFCHAQGIAPGAATRAHLAAYVSDLTQRPHRQGPTVVHLTSGTGLANATIQQRLVAVRLFYDYLVEEGQREVNPVGRGRYTAGTGFGGTRAKGLIPQFTRLPWIPTEPQWQALLQVARQEPIRTRLMLALAYDAGLRRSHRAISTPLIARSVFVPRRPKGGGSVWSPIPPPPPSCCTRIWHIARRSVVRGDRCFYPSHTAIAPHPLRCGRGPRSSAAWPWLPTSRSSVPIHCAICV